MIEQGAPYLEHTPSPELVETWRGLLREIPVAVNNFYGDPLIQWDDTVNKLNTLTETEHTGPVGIITKGVMTPERAMTLRGFIDRGLKGLVVLNSISELPQFEKVPQEHRYTNIRLLNEAGVPTVAYVRPMTPPYNTTPEVIDHIFAQLAGNGAKYVVASGFRGDDAIVHQMNPEQKLKWVLRVKQMTGDVFNAFNTRAHELGMQLFTRTSCGVTAALGLAEDFNPYMYSPKLVRCNDVDCTRIDTCKPRTQPKPGSIELLNYLGVKASVVGGDERLRCSTTGENRLDCPSCCTTCYLMPVPHVHVDDEPNLGTLTFTRFVTGMLSNHEGTHDTGSKDIGKVTLPNFSDVDITCLNTWWPMAHQGDTCFDCSYCIEGYYGTDHKETGFPPVELLKKVGL